jgi:hypothetical protein
MQEQYEQIAIRLAERLERAEDWEQYLQHSAFLWWFAERRAEKLGYISLWSPGWELRERFIDWAIDHTIEAFR